MTSTSRHDWQGGRRDDPSLAEVLYVVWERRPMVAGVVLLLMLVALGFGLFREPVYTAEATVHIIPQEPLRSVEEREAFLEQVRGVVTADEDFNREVILRAGWEGTPEQFRERLDPQTVTSGGEAGLRVRFSGSEPEQAAMAANAYAELFVEKVGQLNDDRIAGGTLAADAAMEQRAVPPERSSLRLLLYAVAAAVAGMLLGGGAALLLEGRARGWRDVRDAELTLRAPVLGVIPDYSSSEKEA